MYIYTNCEVFIHMRTSLKSGWERKNHVMDLMYLSPLPSPPHQSAHSRHSSIHPNPANSFVWWVDMYVCMSTLLARSTYIHTYIHTHNTYLFIYLLSIRRRRRRGRTMMNEWMVMHSFIHSFLDHLSACQSFSPMEYFLSCWYCI